MTELERYMIQYGIVVRGIPVKQRYVLEAMHKHYYPDAEVFYDEKRKRNMIKGEKPLNPNYAGKFIVGRCTGTGQFVDWERDKTFNTTKEAIEYMINKIKTEGGE